MGSDLAKGVRTAPLPQIRAKHMGLSLKDLTVPTLRIASYITSFISDTLILLYATFREKQKRLSAHLAFVAVACTYTLFLGQVQLTGKRSHCPECGRWACRCTV